jgi:hypothetical protein
MKEILVFGFLLIAAAAANGQCQKKITWKSQKTEFLDASGKVEDVKDQPTKIETTPAHITVTTEENAEVIEGDIKDLSCNWKQPFKNGKTTFTSLMAKSNGETRNVTITIEGRDGKIDITVEVEKMQGKKMRLLVDDYKEEI